MTRTKRSLLTPLLFLFLTIWVNAQTTIPRSTPEAEGVSSEGILQFLEAAGKSNHELHSMMVLRHGKVIAEGWWNPFRADLKHTMYSVSKSFTATAVGFAVSENRLKVQDKVVSFFPNDLPPTVSPYLAELSVRDLLSMSAGQEPDPTFLVGRDSNWIRAFLATPIVHKPGSKFLYNSLCTYMLSAIVQKVTGEKIIDYLRPRLFTPLGITGMDWEVDPMGINVGGWGLRVKTEDMAKLGQLFLQKGMWNGKQVLPAAWVEEASTLKIIQHPDLPQAKKDSSDWEQGYCYQMWRSRNNAYRADGAFGQFIIIMPDQDAVVVLTAETSDMQQEFNLVWQYLFPALQKNGPLPPNKKALATLKKKLAALAVPIPAKSVPSRLAKEIAGKTFSLSPNEKFIQSVTFQWAGDKCQVALKTNAETHNLVFGSGKWVFGETSKRGPSLVGRAKAHFAGLPPPKVAGAYRWKDENTLELTLRYYESPHTETFTCRFDQNNLTVEVQSSFEKNNVQVLKGLAQLDTPKPIRLIVRGDDMGFSHSGNEALIKAYREGIETSIEVIVPSPWFPEAVRMLEQNQGVDVGLHLAITSEWDNMKWRPLTDCPSIQNKDGYFFPMVQPNKNYPGQSILENKWKIEDIEKEFRAQIEMALEKIPRISHMSAHMGCAYLSDEVRLLTQRLGEEYNIPLEGGERAFNWTGYDGAHQTLAEKKQSFLKMLQKMEPGKTYLFLDHPGLDGPELQAIHHIGYENVAADRQGVTDLFMDKEIRQFIERNGVQLIGYNDLAQQKDWWKEAIVYQIYPRSFKDSDGDGVGDLKGIISKLDYVKSLGIDMVWLNPVFASPNKDNGYDISDYQNIMKEFGTMADFDALLAGFHKRDIKVFMDLVVNHCSDEHAWFKSARSSRNSPYYNYFHWWPAEKGKPPYRWSIFDEKGDAWEYNKATDSYYLHYFADAQPDLNWENPKMRQEIFKMMRFWLDKGVDGFRLDAIAFCSKDTTWPPLPAEYNGNWGMYYASGPYLHDYMQEMNREVLSKYDVATVAEAMGDVERVMKFVDPARKELDMAYYFEAIDFGYLPNEYKMPDPKGYDLVAWKKIYAKWSDAFAQKGWGTMYLANHDQPRMLTRWGNDSPAFRELSSKMLTTFILSMRGTPYYYYGDEIGMNNIKFDKVEDYNDIELLTNYAQVKAKGGDLNRFLEGMKISSRDNGRTPMQWNTTSNAGFTTGKPWLKVNPNYSTVNVAAQENSGASILSFFKKMVALRKSEPVLIYGDFALVDIDNPSVFAYTRTLDGKKLLVLLNFKASDASVKTGLDLSSAKVLISNYTNPSTSGHLKPYEAMILEIK